MLQCYFLYINNLFLWNNYTDDIYYLRPYAIFLLSRSLKSMTHVMARILLVGLCYTATPHYGKVNEEHEHWSVASLYIAALVPML